MNRQILKSCVAVALAFFLLYSGVAWAMAACLRSHGHSQDAAIDDHHKSQEALESSRPQDPSGPVIHCTTLTQQVGPAARATSAEISRSDKYALLDAVSFPDAGSATLKSNLWLEALFKRIVTFSLPIDLARHLFLSVLQI
jgi:hypothetical protein